MTITTKFTVVLIALLCVQSASFAQVTGVKNIPADYATIAAAVTDLNTNGVGAGGATINVPAGYTETAPGGGYQLGSVTLNASLSNVNTLTFRKNGSGADPLITAPVGTSTSLDGIFILSGVDYVTIDGIDLKESAANTTATTAMEYGFALFNKNSASPFDGCNNNTIKNCTVTMNRTVATASKGIFVAHQIATSVTSLLPSAANDMHSNNKFYANTFVNLITAIFIGGATSANDVGNDIGGTSAATGNTITNVIGALYSSVGAITCTYQTNCNISYNTIDNTANGGTNAIATAWAIYAYGPSCTYTTSNNTITLKEAAISTAYAIYGIYGNASLANITANNNTVSITEVSGSAVNNIAIFLPNGNNTTITGNTVTQAMALSGLTYGIYITSVGTSNLSSNTVKQTSSVATSSQFYSIVSGGAGISETINNNIFDNTNVSVTGTLGYLALIYAANATPNKTITGNTINGALTHSSSSDTYLLLVNPASSIGAGTATIANNNFSNVTKSGTGPLYGLYYAPTSTGSQTVKITNNNLNNFIGGTGSVVGTYIASGAADSIYNNTIQNFSGAGSLFGIYLASPTPADAKVYNNNVHGITSTSATGGAFGISIMAGTTVSVFNNFISDLNATAASSSSSDVIRGIQVNHTTANSLVNLYYNSIYLNASSSGTDFSTTGIYANGDAVATTANVKLINNIIVNTSTPNGAGLTAAYRRSSTALDNFDPSSDHNIFYAGTPAANKLIFYDGTNADQTLSAYQTRVSARDANSLSLMPGFASSTDLHITTSSCSINNKGIPIAGFTTDIDGATRNSIAPDIGADEFAGYSIEANATLATASTNAINLLKGCDDKGWTYYTDPTDGSKFLFAINWDPANVGDNAAAKAAATVRIQVDPAEFTVNSPGLQEGTWTMKRYWNVDLHSATMTGFASVRFFYDPADTTFIGGLASTFATTNSGSLEPPTWFRTKLTSFVGDAVHMNADRVYNAAGLVNIATPGSKFNGTDYAEFNSIMATGQFFGGTYSTGVGPNTPLPVTFNYLRGIKQSGNHLLSWKVTCNSTPKVTLVLERSSDSRTFNDVYSINADAARCQQEFTHTDDNPLNGINYYRLRIVDADGKITYSNIISLLNAVKGFEVMNIAPNPVTTGSFKLNVTSAAVAKMNVVITDMQGRTVHKQTVTLIAGYNSLDMNVVNLAAGTYNIYGSTDQDKSKVIRFVKQ